MKIILKYQVPGTKINGYKFSAVYDETEIDEALAELYSARKRGYEITCWKLVHDEDVESVL
jgi:hypothetical protein